MKKLVLFALLSASASVCFGQVQISGSAVQIGGSPSGVASITNDGRSGQSSLTGSVLNIPNYAGGNVWDVPNFSSLVGAFTDSSGNVIQPVALGIGPTTFPVPHGATQLQLGVNDSSFADGSGSWTVNVNGTPYTVLGTAAPWLHTGGINANYPTLVTGNTAPTVAAIGAEGTPVTIQYVSGTIGNGGICGSPGSGPWDASGQPNCAPTIGNIGETLPGFWTISALSASLTGGITALTGDVTATGPGSVAATLATVNGSPGTCGDATHICQTTTNGKGLVTGQSQVAITGGTGNLKLQDTALDAIPGSPTTWDDEFTGETTLPVKWTQSIGSGCTQGYLNSQQLYLVCGGSASEVPSYIYQAPPGSGTWTFTTKMKLIGGVQSTKILGLYLGDGSNVLDLKIYNNVNVYSYQVCGSNSPTTSTCQTNFAQAPIPSFLPANVWIYLQVAYDGTHYTWNYSFNGINFTQAFQGTSGAFLGSLTQVGIFWSNNGTGGSMSGYSYWFRRTN